MIQTLVVKPLGLVLQKAGLISDQQLAIALNDKSRLSNLRIGEIMAIRGWIKLETANFFAEQWPKLLNQYQDMPLGQYFKAAALLSERQIELILQQQQRTGAQFGSVAVANGLLEQNTVDFFIEQLELAHTIDERVKDSTSISAGQDLRKLSDRLTANKQCEPVDLIKTYQKIWLPSKNNKPKIGSILLVLIAVVSSAVIGIDFWLKIRERKFFRQATKMLQKNEYELALTNYDRVLQIDNRNYQAWHNRGYVLAELKQYQNMFNSCASATAIRPDAQYSWNCQGEALYNLGKYQQAVNAFQQAIALNPQEPLYWLNQAESLLKLEQSQLALEAVNKGIKLLAKNREGANSKTVTTDWQSAWTNKGQALLQQQKYNPALDAFQTALSYNPDYLSTQWGKAIALQKLGYSAAARMELGLILQKPDLSSTQKAVTLFYQGSNFCEVGNITSGINALAMAIKLNPSYEEAKTAQAKCLE